MSRTLIRKIISGLRTPASADSGAVPNANPDVSAIFDELAVQLRSELNSLSEARRVAYLLDKARFEKLVTKAPASIN